MLKTISIVIPVYNEEVTVLKIIDRVLKAPVLGLKKEIIIIDDGSTDNTSKILKKIKDKDLKIYSLRKNNGKGTALRYGFKKTKGDIILVQDADLEYHPKDYHKIIKPFIKNKALVVYGSREISGKNIQSSRMFHIGGRLVTAVTNLLYSSSLTDVPTGYKAFRKDVLMSLPLKCKRFEFCPEVTAHVLKRKIRIMEVPISYFPRTKKEGKKINASDGIEAIWTLLKVRIS